MYKTSNDWIENFKVLSTWKATTVVLFRALFWNFPEGTAGNHDKPARIIGILTEIRKQHLQITSQRYCGFNQKSRRVSRRVVTAGFGDRCKGSPRGTFR